MFLFYRRGQLVRWRLKKAHRSLPKHDHGELYVSSLDPMEGSANLKFG